MTRAQTHRAQTPGAEWEPNRSVDQQQQRPAAGLLQSTLWALRASYRSISAGCCSRQCSAANAGSVMLGAEGRGSKHTCLLTNAETAAFTT